MFYNGIVGVVLILWNVSNLFFLLLGSRDGVSIEAFYFLGIERIRRCWWCEEVL